MMATPGDVGVAEVSHLLHPSCPLKELILHECGVGKAGALKLIKRAALSMPSLRTLDLR